MQRFIAGFRPYFLLTLLCLGMFLPGLTALPPIDRDESRFAQASHQMLESGDYIRIKFQDEYRAKKPAGIYWMQAVSARFFQAEDEIWAYRVPSVLGALAAVLLTFYFGQSMFGRPAALLGASMLAAALILVSEAHQAKTDAVQLACIVLAQGVISRLYLYSKKVSRDKPGNALLLAFWMAQGVGILIKGPIVPMISIVTIITLCIADRRVLWLKDIRPVTGMIVAAAIVAPWASAVSSATGGQFIGTAVKTDLLPKLLGAQESHGAPPGYFLILMLATLWPASLFAVPGFVRAVKHRHGAALRFCLAWIVPNWIIFEIVPTKLPHYVLPAYPALCLLAGIAVAADEDMLRSRLARGFYALWALVGLALAGAAVAAPMILGHGFLPASVPAAAAALTAGVLPAILAWRNHMQGAVAAAVLGALLTYGTIFQTVMPNLDRMWLSRDINAIVTPGTPLAAAGFHEPSMVFLQGTQTKLVDGSTAARFLLDTPHASAVIESEAEADFDKTLADAHRSAKLIGSAEGFNYSRGRPAHLKVWQLENAQ